MQFPEPALANWAGGGCIHCPGDRGWGSAYRSLQQVPSETGSGIKYIKLHNPGVACEMQIRESAVATAGGANRNPQGVQWGEREGESQDTAYTPTPPKAQGRTGDRTAEQSQRGLLQGNVCKP